MSAAEIKNSMYDPIKINALFQTLVQKKQEGKEPYYEILVDNFMVIAKTADLDRFMSYSDFVTPETKTITISCVKGNGQRDHYFFALTNDALKEIQQQLNGVPNAKPIDEKEILEKVRHQMHYEALIKENEELREEVLENERMYFALEQKMADVQGNRDLTFSSAATILLNGVTNIDVVKKSPILSALTGTNLDPNAQKAQPETEATFKRKSTTNANDIKDAAEVEEDENGESVYRMTEKQRKSILFIEDIRKRIGQEELTNVMHLLDLVSSYPSVIPYAIRHVTNFIKMKKEHEKKDFE